MEVLQWLHGRRTSTSSSSSSSSSIASNRGVRLSNNHDWMKLEEDRDRIFGRIAHRAMQNKENQRDKDEDNSETPTVDQGDVTPQPELAIDESEEATATEEPEVQVQDQAEDQVEETQQPGASTTVVTAEGDTRIDLVRLVPFDVKLSLLEYEESSFNYFALTDVVTDWLEETLEAQIQRMELGLSNSEFDSVILEGRSIQTIHDRQRTLQSTTTQYTTTAVASYEGVTLWTHTNTSEDIISRSHLEDIQRQVLLQDDRLLELLRLNTAQGLGDSVTDVKAYFNPNTVAPTTTTPTQTIQVPAQKENANANLELVIVVAIVVACMAFAFLVFSLFWAWRFDQQRRDQAYRVQNTGLPVENNADKRKSPSGCGGATDNSEYEDHESSPSTMNVLVTAGETNPTTGDYSESVVSEDVSTSLSAYYRSGMGSRPLYGSARANADFNDQASFSSMESYGYSLDGYAPSLGGTNLALTKGDDDLNTKPNP